MGFFSWKTQNTNRSIANSHSIRPTFPVVMVDNKGNQWLEENYDGYGIFGGKDYYELLAEMNGREGTRIEGINLSFGTGSYITPNLFEKIGEGDVPEWSQQEPESCEYQGFFYPSYGEDEDEDEEDEYYLED